jgi:tetratricopeptide (TPR) repeat protein
MRVNRKWLAVLLLLAALPLSGCSFSRMLRARDYSNKGVKQFGDQKFGAAAQFFEKALEEDPSFEIARLYLATSYMSQYVPGSTDPKSEKMALKAIDTFKDIAEKGDKLENKKNSMIAIAGLYYNLKRTKESKDWCYKVINLDPNSAEAYYRIAVVDYDSVADQTGVSGEGVDLMTPDAKKTAKEAIDEGLQCLDKATALQPNYWDAMEYQNYLWREKAKFESDEKIKQGLVRKADELSIKVVKMKLEAQREERKKPKKIGVK